MPWILGRRCINTISIQAFKETIRPTIKNSLAMNVYGRKNKNKLDQSNDLALEQGIEGSAKVSREGRNI